MSDIIEPPFPVIHQICRNCEWFDIGAMGADGSADCYNRQSPRFQTKADMTCLSWQMTSELWGDIEEPVGSA